MEQPTTVKKYWASGDHFYAAIAAPHYPGGLHHISVDEREYPVARVSKLACDEFSLLCWIKRTERFPEPIKGYNIP